MKTFEKNLDIYNIQIIDNNLYKLNSEVKFKYV